MNDELRYFDFDGDGPYFGYDEPTQPHPPSPQKSAFKKPKLSTKYQLQEGKKLVFDSASGGTQPRAVIHQTTNSGRIIPLEAHIHVQALVELASMELLQLDAEEQHVLNTLNIASVDLVDVDPSVLLMDSLILKNGCKVAMREEVPVSLLLAARHLKCTYGVAGECERSYDGVGVDVFYAQDIEDFQPFNCLESVTQALQQNGRDPEHIFEQIRGYMIKLGVLDPHDVADGVWQSDHQKDIADICDGRATHVALK